MPYKFNPFTGSLDETGATGATGTVNAAGPGTFAAPSISFAGDTDTGLFNPDANTLAFTEGGSEAMRIDSSARLLVGTSTSASSWSSTALEIIGTTTNGGNLVIGRNDTTITTDNSIGAISFWGNDSSGTYEECARITADADLSHDTGDKPTRLVFSTTADGASSPTERMRVTSTGRMGLGTVAPAALAHVAGNTIVSNVDVANASYDSISFSVAAEDTSPVGLFFSNDGSKMFVIGSTGDDINEYTLSTPWNVSTATFVTVFSVAAQDTVPQDLYFRNDGKKLYIVGSGNDTVFQYTLSTPWSIASASYDSVSFSVATEEATPAGLFFKSNGLAFYIVGTTQDTVYRYNLTTAWDISTATLANSFSVTAQETSPNAISFTIDGSRMFVLGTAGDDVNIYNLTTAWDITTASFVTAFSIAAQEAAPAGLFVKPDGTKFYIVGTTNDTVYQYTIPSATIDLTGTTNINGSAEIAQDLTVYGGISSGSIQLAAAGNISVGTTTGTKIGTATTQKLGFYNATPVVQPAAVANATTAVDVITQLNALLAKLRTLGIIAT